MKKSEHMTRQALLAELFILHLKEEAFRSYIGKPYALEKIAELGYRQEDVSSQSWLLYVSPNALESDVVMTVYGNAAAEDCPVFPGNWKHIHWGLPDPASHMDSPSQAKASFNTCLKRTS